jgi:PAS domain S-box-containing protein
MAAQTMKKRHLDLVAILILVVLLLAALHMMSGAVQRSDMLNTWFLPLLLFTVVGLALLVLLVGWSLWQLLRDYRRQAAGARLNVRLVVMFVVLSLVPVSVVYVYSLQFLSKGIDSWFDVQVDSAMEDALSLSKVSLDLHKREALKLTQSLLNSLQDTSKAGLSLQLAELRENSGAAELSLVDWEGNAIALSHLNPEVLTPSPITPHMLKQASAGEPFVRLVPLQDGRLVVRCLVSSDNRRGLLLQAIYPVSDSLSTLTGNVQSAYEAYRARAYLRESIKFSFALTLSLVLLLGLFAAAWAAFYTSRRLVKPIKAIAEGTREVAEGNYGKQLPLPRLKDELNFLVDSFNEMTRRIAQARNAEQASRHELQTQHNYLETVLGALSTGVMALDSEGNLQTANPAAAQILGKDLTHYRDMSLQELSTQGSHIQPFVQHVLRNIEGQHHADKAEIVLQGETGNQVLLYQQSPLYTGDKLAGFVLVFDDVTELVSAQRDAAWGEVARRLAHEIKNPLTPIQLSAERMRRKYLPNMSTEEADILERATRTIVQQVEALKTMVNEFSDYARPCNMSPKPLLIDEFIAEVTNLYEGVKPPVHFQANAKKAALEADAVRLRQVLHNLIKNGQEALADTSGEVLVSTCLIHKANRDWVRIQVEDDGSGFDPASLNTVFDPYVTSKLKGTGLGLAIVKRIIGEHGGSVRAENRPQRGARIEILLPVQSTERVNKK